MWRLIAHNPAGPATEDFDAEADALAAQQRVLARGFAVTLDPTAGGRLVPTGCTFCGKPRAAVRRLCAGPSGTGVAICDECVALASEIFAEEATAPGL